MTGSATIGKGIVLSYKMAEKGHNEETNSQSSQQEDHEKDLQNLVGDGGNNEAR